MRKIRLIEYAGIVINQDEVLKHKKGYKEYHITVQAMSKKGYSLKRVSGKEIRIEDSGMFRYFQHQSGDGFWVISELSTGFCVSKGSTLKAALESSIYKISVQVNHNNTYTEVVASVIRKLGGVVNEIEVEDLPVMQDKKGYTQRRLIL